MPQRAVGSKRVLIPGIVNLADRRLGVSFSPNTPGLAATSASQLRLSTPCNRLKDHRATLFQIWFSEYLFNLKYY